MFRYSFSYSNSPLTITSAKKFDTRLLDNVYDLVELLKFDLNHKIYDSTAYNFNEAAKDAIVNASKEFIFFLKLNIFFSKEYPKFYPFLAEHKFTLETNIEDLIEIDEKNSSIRKKTEIKLDTSFLRASMVIDSIADFLRIKKVDGFLVSLGEAHRAFGKESWAIDFSQDDFKEKVTICNASTSFAFGEEKHKRVNAKFLGLDKVLNYQYLTITSQTGAMENAIYHLLAKDLYMESDYRIFVEKLDCNLIVVDFFGKKFEFGK